MKQEVRASFNLSPRSNEHVARVACVRGALAGPAATTSWCRWVSLAFVRVLQTPVIHRCVLLLLLICGFLRQGRDIHPQQILKNIVFFGLKTPVGATSTSQWNASENDGRLDSHEREEFQVTCSQGAPADWKNWKIRERC